MSSKRNSRVIQQEEETENEENSTQMTRSKKQKMKQARLEEEDDEADTTDEEENNQTSKQKSSKKRKTENTRSQKTTTSLSQRADTVELSDQEDPNESHLSQPNPTTSSKTLARDRDGYLPGSIVRVALRNFVTYEHVEFVPGPYLNMIIGPNGTGKSTLVCAIALGLGFPTSVLDRASEVKLYIKNGAEEGFVEIELKGHPGQSNVTIKLNLILASNNRVFEVNGKRSTISHVQEIIKSFNIQANNLCCFLPQEKVSKFAELKEAELLKETQRVAGHRKLTEWHEILIEDGKEKINTETKLSGCQRSYKEIEKQVENLQQDVDRLEERKTIENKIKAIALGLDQNKYLQEKLRHDTAKIELNEAKAEIAQLEEENAPLNDQKEYFRLLSQEYESVQSKIQTKLSYCRNAMQKLEPSLKSATNQLEDASGRLSTLKEDERRQKELRVKLTMEVERLSEKIKVPVQEPDRTPFSEEISATSQRIRQIQADIENLQLIQKDTYGERKNLIEQQNEINREIQNLQSVSGRKEADLEKYVFNVYQALQRFKKIKAEGRFRGKVFEPIRLSISPKNPQFVRAIEGCINNDLLNTFLFTDPHDYELMAEECNDRDKLRVNLACMRPGDSLSNYPSPLNENELKDLGFDDFLINLINGPDEVLAHLCNQSRLHLIPIAHNPRARVDESRFKDRNFPIKSWIKGSTRFVISFSAYGSREMIIKSVELHNPKILNVADVDPSILANKRAMIEGLLERDREKEELINESRAKEARLRQEYDKLRERKKELEANWEDARKPHLEYLKNVASHRSQSHHLQVEMNKPTFDQERGKRRAALLEASKAYAAIVIKLKNYATQSVRLNTNLITLNLKIFQHQTNREAFKEVFKTKNADLIQTKLFYQQNEANLREMYTQAKETAKQLRHNIQSASPEISAGLAVLNSELTNERKKYKDEEGMNEEDILNRQYETLTKALEDEQVILEDTHPVDPSILERYDRLTKQLAREKQELDSFEAATRRCQDKIKRVYEKWRPRLDELINNIDEKFDAAFKRMGCLGHIKLVTDDPDYDKWGIEIQVSFRDNEPLVRLDPHRQSGGERSLSTIMYLMSLTELGNSPFSLVDEINQGMDRRAERLVHDQLVETTCKESASQYFLITPKLLFGLRYHPLMRVLCVNNGDWLPPNFKLGPWLHKAKKLKNKNKNLVVNGN